MPDRASSVMSDVAKLVTHQRSRWWYVFWGGLIAALVFALVTVSIVALDRGTQVSQYRDEQRCRADVQLALILSVVDVVDPLGSTPRDQSALDAALIHMHVVRAAAKALQASKACGFSGGIPSPGDPVTTSPP